LLICVHPRSSAAIPPAGHFRSALRFACYLFLALLLSAARETWAGEPAVPADESETMPLNVESPTLGGWQWWGDVVVFHEWRIQRHTNTNHYRLLDKLNVRHAWGTFEQCRAKLEQIKRDQHLPPMQPRVVLLLHGLLRTRGSMHKMATSLEGAGLGEAMCISYPSTRASIGAHAQSLGTILSNLGSEVREIDLVAHSLGNLVIRHYYGDHRGGVNGPPDPRIRRIVMLGPPNHPPERAQLWSQNPVLSKVMQVAVPAGELSKFAELEPKLATPTCEFGILAGGKGDDQGWHPWLPGDDDTTVTVAETRLVGATDFAVLPVIHTLLTSDDRAIGCTKRFLQDGYFFSLAQRQPIVSEAWSAASPKAAPAPVAPSAALLAPKAK
jgi:pimeloyl-ACP methyl ester carboxylesterase